MKFSFKAHYSEDRLESFILKGVMYFGAMRAGPSWCLLDLDARRRSGGLGFDLLVSLVATFLSYQMHKHA